MRFLLFLFALLAAAVGFLCFVGSINAPLREVESVLFFLIAAVLFSASATVDNLVALKRDLKSNWVKLDRLGAALATPPEIEADTDPGAASSAEPAETYLVQLSDGVRGTFTHAQLQALLDRGSIDQRAYILPQGASKWIRVSDLVTR